MFNVKLSKKKFKFIICILTIITFTFSNLSFSFSTSGVIPKISFNADKAYAAGTAIYPQSIISQCLSSSSYLLMSDGTVRAWGYNGNGGLGIGNTTQQNSPVTVTGLSNVKQLAPGGYYSLALMNDGTVKAWGQNNYGQLGIGNTTQQNSPVTVTGLSNVKQLWVGWNYSFALMNDRTVKAWGQNDYGQLGIGNTTQQNSPVTVPGLTNVNQLVAGCTHTLALMDDGTVKAWGNNGDGELGIGNHTRQMSPVTVPGLTNVSQLVAGGYYSLALLNDGTVKAWGQNSNGELGTGNTTSPNSPVTVTGLSNIKQLSAGGYHSLALLNDGTVKAWGNNVNGPLGIGNTTQQNSPVTVTGLSNVKQLGAGGLHSVALMNDGTVKAWGRNTYGDLGIGNTTEQHSPTLLSAFNAVNITPPTISLTQTPTTPTNGNIVITATASATGTGNNIATTKWAVGNQTVSYFASSGTVLAGTTFTVNANGTYTVYAKDTSGNETIKAIIINNINIAAPTNFVASSITGTSLTLAWTASSSVGVTGYDIYNGTTLVGSTTTALTYNVTGLAPNTAYSFTVKAKDAAGNVSDASQTINVIVGPVISISPPTIWGQINTITANITDATSGIALQKWAIGKNVPASFFVNNGTVFSGNTFTVSQDGDYTIYVIDNSGNISLQNVTVDHIYTDSPTGDYSKSFSNMSVNSPGMNMNFGLTYNSNDKTTGQFGTGWTFSYSGSVKDYQYSYSLDGTKVQTATMSGIKLVKLPDGVTYTYVLNNGVYTGCNTNNKLTQNADGSYTLVTTDKITYTFNTNGYLSLITDKNGNKVTINVDVNGKISTVIDTAGRVYTLNYTSNAITLTDPMNRTVTYTLTNGSISSISDPMNRITNQFSYDESGYLSNVKDGLNNTTASITYDHSNKDRIVSTTDENNNILNYTYNDTDNSVTSTDANNKQNVTWYNSTNQVIKSQDKGGNKTFNLYDGNGNILKEITPKNGTDEYTATADQTLFDINSHQYDSTGNLTNNTYLDATTEAYTYDGNQNVLNQTDKDGTMTFYQYDNKGNVTLKAVRKSGTDYYTNSLTDAQKQNFDVTQYTYNSDGTPNTTKNPDGSVITYSNYTNGNSQTVANSISGTITYVYNTLGWITSKTAADGKVTISDYNKDGTVIRSKAGSDVTRYIFDANGRLVQQIDPAQYDSTKDGLNNSPATDTYSDANVGVRYTYDTHSNIQSKTDAKNYITNYTYDNHNNVVKSVYNNTDVTRYVYNTDNKLTQQINPDQYNASKDGWVGSSPVNTYSDSTVGYRYVYNSEGKIQTETYPNGQVFHYNDLGKVTSVDNNATGVAVSGISYTYDDNDNISTISENGTQKVKYYYDTNNQLIREDNVWKNQTIAYGYDERGNILSKSVYDYTTADSITTTASHVYTYSYTDSADKDKITSYDGMSIGYDASGNMTSYNGWTYSWNGKNLATSTNGTVNISYQYTTDGFRTQKTVNGVTTTYTLNGDNNITSETNGTDIINYTRDVNGNLLGMTLNGTKYTYETNAQGDIIGLIDCSNNEVVTYSYDSWGKLLNIGGSLASTVGVKNPFRYRSYYYDTETGMYYLNARYYNPEICRMISKDDASYHEGAVGAEANLYAYGNNNPVMNSDPSGHIAAALYGAAYNAIIAYALYWAEYLFKLHKWSDWDCFISVACNAAIGAVSCGIAGPGRFAPRASKVIGIAQKEHITPTAIRILKAFCFLNSKIITFCLSKMRKSPGESWISAIKGFIPQLSSMF